MKRIIPWYAEWGAYVFVVLAVFSILSELDAFEKLYAWSRAHEKYEVDELLLLIPAVLLALVLMSTYKSYLLHKEISSRKEYEKELQEAMRKLSLMADDKKHFMDIVSHEMRGPVSSVQGVFYALSEIKDQEMKNELLVDARHAMDNLRNLLEDVFDFARLESSDTEAPLEVFNPREIFAIADRHFQKIAAESGLRYRFEIADDVPEIICGFRLAFHQSLFNLVQNALKFTDSGEVSIELNIERHGAADDCVLLLKVQDTGAGIPDHELGRIFEPYTRLDETLSRKHKGIGLGLSTVRRLVRLARGDIEVRSVVGEGSTFIVWLPVDISDGRAE